MSQAIQEANKQSAEDQDLDKKNEELKRSLGVNQGENTDHDIISGYKGFIYDKCSLTY